MSERLSDERLREFAGNRYGVDAIRSMARELIALRAENEHLRKRCTWLQGRRKVLQKLAARRLERRRELQRLRKAVAELRAARMSDDIAELGMLVREYGAADDADLTDAAKELKRRVLDACEPLLHRAARAPEGLSEMLSHILDEHEDEMIDWCHDQSKRDRPDTDDVIFRILALIEAAGPVMPEVPSEAVRKAALRVLSPAIMSECPSAITLDEMWPSIRTALIAEQKEIGA